MKTGWIFRIKGKARIYSSGYGVSENDIPTTKVLRWAVVVPTRSKAREVKANKETILQAALTQRGIPKKILSRG